MVYRASTFVYSLGFLLLSVSPLLIYLGRPGQEAVSLVGSSLMLVSAYPMKPMISIDRTNSTFLALYLGTLLTFLHSINPLNLIRVPQAFLYAGLLLISIALLSYPLRYEIRKVRCVFGLSIVFIGSVIQGASFLLYFLGFYSFFPIRSAGGITSSLGLATIAFFELEK